VGHAAVHDVPQLLAVDGDSHVPLQESVLAGQVHCPSEQVVPVGHTLPHFPQLLESV
jgi:hypothetical protein